MADQLPQYDEIFEGDDEVVFGFDKPVYDQVVDWVDLVLDDDDAVINDPRPAAEGAPPWDILQGLNGDDTIYGDDDGYNAFYGGGGNDRIFGGDGEYNYAWGGTGDDEIHVGKWGTAYGGDGDDVIYGGAVSRLSGGDGDDTLYSTGFKALLHGGTGDDTYHLSSGGDRIFYRPGDGTDTVHGFQSSTRLDVSDFGFASAERVLTHATESGNDLRINFGGSNEIILVDFVTSGVTLDVTNFVI